MVTLGVAYLSFTTWMDGRTEAEDRRRMQGMGSVRCAQVSLPGLGWPPTQGRLPSWRFTCICPTIGGATPGTAAPSRLCCHQARATHRASLACVCKLSHRAPCRTLSLTAHCPSLTLPWRSSGSSNGAGPKKAPKKETAAKEPEAFKGFGKK